MSKFPKVRKFVRVTRVLLMLGGAAFAIAQKVRAKGKPITVDQWPDVTPKPAS